jgi:predicted O-methyltransferase YrrM
VTEQGIRQSRHPPIPRYGASETPPLVLRAYRLAAKAEGSWPGLASSRVEDAGHPLSSFRDSCIPEVGRLLHVLAASIREGIVGEIGTGYGIGAAWIVSALRPTIPFVSVEIEPFRARTAGILFGEHPNVSVITGDWHQLLSYGPFSLLFVDVSDAKQRDAGAVVDALATGGLVVLDDLTPAHLWTREQRELWAVDPVRSFWLDHPSLVSTELLVRPDSAVIVAARRP